MKLNDHFRDFIGKISLNPTRINRIESALKNWESKFKEDEELEDLFLDLLPQGSYSTGTAIKPQNYEEFDVDVVLTLDLTEQESPKELLKTISDRVKSHTKYKDEVKTKDRCVRNYSGDFYVDVVPAFPFNDMIKIPSKKEDQWVLTNPVGFTSWCNRISKKNDTYFSKVVKIMKHWRDYKVGKNTAPKSILLTTLIGNSFVKHASIAETLVETLRELLNKLNTLVDDEEIFVENPSLVEENLARDWDHESAQRFIKKIKKLIDNCQDALDDNDKESSIEKWQKIFGETYFPSEVAKAKNMADKIEQGSVKVNSEGILNEESGTKIKKHRFFGGNSSETL